MKIRIRFQKDGVMKFIGHLDIMRYFQKAMRRAEIPICYSEGYSPHQIMSFASPLGVGLTSTGEYMDIEISEEISSKEAMRRLNETMVPGMEVLSFKKLPEQAKNAMSIVAQATYTMTCKDGYEIPFTVSSLAQMIQESFAEAEHFFVTKKTKKSEKIIDLKDGVEEFSVTEEKTSKKPRIFMRVSAGSEQNIKPEFVLQALLEHYEMPYNPYAFQIHRNDLFALQEGRMISMDEMGEDIE